MTDYIPIDCSRYSEYELAIMHRTRLRLGWRDAAGASHLALLVPTDLRTRRGEEYLIAVNPAGGKHTIRLDRIISSEPVE
ncbi:MAG: transcriptional antiterminator, Rof [Gammaproteobacteria bacterium]|jgi:Rho-binding antiterminator